MIFHTGYNPIRTQKNRTELDPIISKTRMRLVSITPKIQKSKSTEPKSTDNPNAHSSVTYQITKVKF